MNTKTVKTPELDKMLAVKQKSQVISGFIEWLEGQGIELGRYVTDTRLAPLHMNIELLLAQYFDIDLDEAENEKRAILEQLRNKPKRGHK